MHSTTDISASSLRASSDSTPSSPLPNPLRIALTEPLLVANRQAFKIKIVDAIAEGRSTVVIDIAACGYIDASGLGALVSLSKKCTDAGGSLTLENVTPEQLEYFAMIRLDTVLTLRAAPASLEVASLEVAS